MADAAFATRRKTIANSCKTYFAGTPEVQAALPAIFEQAGVDPRRRGETLTQEEFIDLGRALIG
jgi:16S rRNA (adenine1518-N6/adenine1519-N6)-dimethyltransferase